jgi:hypothetical protein
MKKNNKKVIFKGSSLIENSISTKQVGNNKTTKITHRITYIIGGGTQAATA